MHYVVQQVESSAIKFDVVPAFGGGSAASRLTWSQKVVYQARSCGFETELTADEGEGLSVGSDVFDGNGVASVILRNANVAWMTRINSCRGMVF